VCDGHNSNQLVKPMNCEPMILAESNSFKQQNNFHSIYQNMDGRYDRYVELVMCALPG
jgi:hypothetical protein